MAKINFQSDEMLSFYELWVSLLGAKPEKIDQNLNGIGLDADENELFKNSAKRVAAVRSQEPIFGGLQQLGNKLFENDHGIDNFEKLQNFVTEKFPADYASQVMPPLKDLYQVYHESYLSSQAFNERKAALSALDALQSDEKVGYQRELRQIYSFFGVNEQTPIKANINLYQTKFMNDGMAASKGFFMNPVIADKDESCVNNSAIQSRKISTPFHESTHFLFAQSGKDKDFLKEINNVLNGGNPQNLGMYQVASKLKAYFEQNPQAKRYGNINDNLQGAVFGAFNEAMGATASAIIDEKVQKNGFENQKARPDYDILHDKGREWYSQFEGANQLAPLVYPLMKKYMEQGKELDNLFFVRLASAMNNLGQQRTQQTDKPKVENQTLSAPILTKKFAERKNNRL